MNLIKRIRGVANSLRLMGTNKAELNALELESIAHQLEELAEAELCDFEEFNQDPRTMGWVDSKGRP